MFDIESSGVSTEGGLSLWYTVLMSYITAIACKEVEGTSYVGGAGPVTRLMESGGPESKLQNRWQKHSRAAESLPTVGVGAGELLIPSQGCA